MPMNKLPISPAVRRLSAAERRQFEEWGYVKNLPVFAPEALPVLQQRCRELAERLPEDIDLNRVTTGTRPAAGFLTCAARQPSSTMSRTCWGRIFFSGAASFLSSIPVTDRWYPGTRTPSTGRSARAAPSPSGWRSTMPIRATARCAWCAGSHRRGALRHHRGQRRSLRAGTAGRRGSDRPRAGGRYGPQGGRDFAARPMACCTAPKLTAPSGCVAV